MNDGQLTTHHEPDPAPFKVHLLTRAGRVMRARSEPVRAFSKPDDNQCHHRQAANYALGRRAQDNAN
jgi:hypothetical protein